MVRNILRRRFHSLLRAAAGLSAVGVLGSCGGGSDVSGPGDSGQRTAVIVVAPSTSTVAVGATMPLNARAEDAAGNVVPGVTIHWSSSDTTVAVVSSAGVVSARSVGSVQISASGDGVSAPATLTVVPVPVSRIAISPSTGTVSKGATISLGAIAYDSTGAVLSGRQVTWATGNPAVATVNGSGVVTGVAHGSATISATCEGKTATAQITVPETPVAPVPVASVLVTPATMSLQVTKTGQLTAVPKDASGNALSGRAVTWSSENPSIAAVSGSGLVTAVSAGTVTIRAVSEQKTGTSAVTVTPAPPPPPAPVDTVNVTPATATVAVGATVTLSAAEFDANGLQLLGRSVTWSTSDQKIATVSSTGVVTGVAAGTATISATSEGKVGGATITVTSAPTTQPATVAVASVVISPSDLLGASPVSIRRNRSQDFTARAYDANGNELAGRVVSWTLSSGSTLVITSADTLTPSIAIVTASDTTGPAGSITATSEGKADRVTITVRK